MKTIITIWLLFCLSVFAQSDCDKYETFLKKVDENYSELSNRPFQNYLKYTLSQKDTLKTSLFNVKGELVYKENFGLLDVGTYIIKFYNPKCQGIYFVSSEIGNQPAYKKSILITSEISSLNGTEINADTSTSIIDGIWKRSYSEKFIPALQFEPEFHKSEYLYKYNLQVNFSKGDYKILTEIINDDNSVKEIKTFWGRFITEVDTLKLYENSKLKKVFQYKIEKDTLSLSFFVSQDKNSGAILIPMDINIFNRGIKLVGMYHK